jgi:hypothetical protein
MGPYFLIVWIQVQTLKLARHCITARRPSKDASTGSQPLPQPAPWPRRLHTVQVAGLLVPCIGLTLQPTPSLNDSEVTVVTGSFSSLEFIRVY